MMMMTTTTDLEVEGFVDLTEAALAKKHEQEVSIVEDWVIVEAALVLVVNPLQLANVQVPLAFQLLHLELQVPVFLLQCVLLQLLVDDITKMMKALRHCKKNAIKYCLP